jgi:hypothetical protein
VHIGRYDPELRARQKAESRARDEAALRAGQISRESLQHVNGGYGMLRASRLVVQPKVRPSRVKRAVAR